MLVPFGQEASISTITGLALLTVLPVRMSPYVIDEFWMAM
jgi:hypothetical protein